MTMRQNIEVKNTRLEVVKIKVTDALAISSEDKIKVSVVQHYLAYPSPLVCCIPLGCSDDANCSDNLNLTVHYAQYT